MHRRSTGAQGLVFGGIMAALVVLFALIPWLSMLMPLPLVLGYVRYGGRVAALASIVAALFGFMFLGLTTTATLLIPAGILPGLAFGYGFRHRLKPLTIGFIALAAFVVGYAGTYMISRVVLFGGRDPIAAFFESAEGQWQLEQMRRLADLWVATLPQATPEQQAQVGLIRAQFQEALANPVAVTWTVLPSSLALIGSFTVWVNYLLCRVVLRRFGHEVPSPSPFGEYYLPAWLVWVFAIASFGAQYLKGSILGAPWWVQVLANVLPPLYIIFIAAGMAVAYGFLRKQKVPKAAAVGLTLVGLFLGPSLYMMLAIWDSLFDFRGLGHGLFKRPS